MKIKYVGLLALLIGFSQNASASDNEPGSYFKILNTSSDTAAVKHRHAAEHIAKTLHDKFETEGWGESKSSGSERILQDSVKEYSLQCSDKAIVRQAWSKVQEEAVKDTFRKQTNAFAAAHIGLIEQVADAITRNWAAEHCAEFNRAGLLNSVQDEFFKMTYSWMFYHLMGQHEK